MNHDIRMNFKPTPKVGDRVEADIRWPTQVGTVRLVNTRTAIPQFTVQWDNGNLGRHTIASIRKVIGK